MGSRFIAQHGKCIFELTTGRNFVRLSCSEHDQLGIYSMVGYGTMYDAMNVARKDAARHVGVDTLQWLMVD